MFTLDLADIVERANADGEFQRAARDWNGLLELNLEGDSTTLRLVGGHLDVFPGHPALREHDIRIAAARRDWEELLSRAPRPGWHDVVGAQGFAITANMLDFAPYYAAIRRLLDLMRDQIHGAVDFTPEAPASGHDRALGRYVYVEVAGTEYRVYYEETGSGIPLLLLHTAGADGRQWRHVLENQRFQERYRLVAVDLPYHGKSIPPTTKPWWREEYRLTRAFLVEFFDRFASAIGAVHPVFMGCSIGGLLAPDLAYYRPGAYRAVIGVNGSLAIPRSQLANPEKVQSWCHPRVSNDWKASSMLGQMAPGSPEPYRRETAWVYSQGAPPIFAGDIYYYMQDHDLTAEQAAAIDTQQTGVYLLTGEYDALARSGGSKALADAIGGSSLQITEGIGHFGPSENPALFMEALTPVLNDIADRYPS